MGMLSVTHPALANLDAAMSTRAAPASQLSGVIKSVQRGTADLTSVTTLNVTVSSVTVAKCAVMFIGARGTDATKTMATLQLTSTTNLQIDRNGSTGGPVVSWQIVEYY